MSSPNLLKAALRRGDRQIGLWLSLGSPTATEVGVQAGFDWVLIDMEHTPNSEGDVLGHLRAAHGGTAEPMVRVPWNDMVVIKRVLDIGARSLLVPYVQNADEARRAVAATRYPPAGVRGFSGTTRANNYGRDTGYSLNSSAEIFLAVQVESPEAIKNVAAIAAVEGVDGVFVGPNDLAANMGFIGQPNAPAVRDMAASILGPVTAAGKAAGILDFNVESAKGWLEAGFQFVAVGSDLSLLIAGVNQLVAAHR